MSDLVRYQLERFCLDFVREPYLCYTEHGQHALFYARLWEALPTRERTLLWNQRQVARLQKEYPTASALGKPQRQHWDIALLRSPAEHAKEPGYDYLRLDSVVEFGMNEAKEHLADDLQRLSHTDANVDHPFAVHLHRLSRSGDVFSGRDWSASSTRLASRDELAELSGQFPEVGIIFAVADSSGTHEEGAWRLKAGECAQIR